MTAKKDSLRIYKNSRFNFLLGGVKKKFDEKIDRADKDPLYEQELQESFLHALPKVFFFLIPLLAMFMKLFFLRRKDLYFVDHVIFSLHWHSLCFVLMILPNLYPFENGVNWLLMAIFSYVLIYFIIAIVKIYKTSIVKSIFITLTTTVIYTITLGISVILLLGYA